MRAHRIGRTLGIGVRVAARIATGRVAEPGQRVASQKFASTSQTAGTRGQTIATNSLSGSHGSNHAAGEAAAPAATQAGQALGHTAQGVTRGVGGFLRPFRRVGGILWLEVTGVFFLLPVVVFAPALWRELANYHHTTDHKTLWLTAVIIAVFLYLGVSSFWRARRRANSQ